MRVLFTGGSGDLGKLAGPTLEERGHAVTNLDLRPPSSSYGKFLEGSVLDRGLLARVLPEYDCVVHIAALHGIHEFRKSASRHQFWDINVTGTFNLLEAAREAHIGRFVFISSTSIDDPESFYGHTKLLAEETCRSFTVLDERMSIIRLRPRAFIPHWNREVYGSFVDWAKWFWGGAVHINDVSQALVKSVELLARGSLPGCPMFVVDGKYDYSELELAAWDREGPGSTFRKRYGEDSYKLAVSRGLDPSLKPKILDITETRRVLGYVPTYSVQNLLEELAEQP